MSITITVRLYQKDQDAYFHVIEQSVWENGSWFETDGLWRLTMGSNDSSGTLLFLADTNERFIVALGTEGTKPWCDIDTAITPHGTGLLIQPQYYNGGPREYMREKALDTYSVKNAAGRNFQVVYTQKDGNNLAANIIIG